MNQCPRCGRSIANDPTRTTTGDHLVPLYIERTPIRLGRTRNEVLFIATQPRQEVRLWCSTIHARAAHDAITDELVACTLGSRRHAELRTDALGRIAHAIHTIRSALRQILPNP